MSSLVCQAGDTQGFPVRLTQSIHTQWPGTGGNKIENLVQPLDFSIRWGSSGSRVPLMASFNGSSAAPYLHVRGFDSIANGTTLIYEGASYRCSDVLSICDIQHSTLSQGNPLYEAILAFQIENPRDNPSLPHVFLMCRPLTLGGKYRPPEQRREQFSRDQCGRLQGGGTYVVPNPEYIDAWQAINVSVRTNDAISAKFNPKDLFTYGNNELLPLVSYQTCLNTQTEKGTGSIRVRVCVVLSPLSVPADNDNIIAQCKMVRKYQLITSPKRLTDLTDSSRFAFKKGSSFPATGNWFYPEPASGLIGDYAQVMLKFQILVNAALYDQVKGQYAKGGAESLDSLVSQPRRQTSARSAKCYRVNPDKDIRNGKIIVDPATGQPLSQTLSQDALDSAGGDPDLAAALSNAPENPGIMPGDIQKIVVICVSVFGGLLLAAYLGYILHMVFALKAFNRAFTHGIIFVLLLVGLVIFGVFFSDGTEPQEDNE